jgi:quercetin dioxygenase-like cupin family protein
MQNQLSLLDIKPLAEASHDQHLLGSIASSDLNVNMLAFGGEDGIAEHTNSEVDVLIVAMDGTGVVTVDGSSRQLVRGQAAIIPKGTARAIRSAGDRFVYLTCHRRRSGLMPTRG